MTMKVWKLHERKTGPVLRGHAKSVGALVITKDNKYIISGSQDHSVRIWNTQDNYKQEAVLQGHTKEVKALVVTSDSNYIITGSGTIR